MCACGYLLVYKHKARMKPRMYRFNLSWGCCPANLEDAGSESVCNLSQTSARAVGKDRPAIMILARQIPNSAKFREPVPETRAVRSVGHPDCVRWISALTSASSRVRFAYPRSVISIKPRPTGPRSGGTVRYGRRRGADRVVSAFRQHRRRQHVLAIDRGARRVQRPAWLSTPESLAWAAEWSLHVKREVPPLTSRSSINASSVARTRT
jgi:hypothetical protein